MQLDGIFQAEINKYFLKKEIEKICEQTKIPPINIKYENLCRVDALAESHTNTIIFNNCLLNGTSIYKSFNTKELQVLIQSVVAHEVEHLRQYQNNIDMINTPSGLGEHHIIINKETKYSFSKLSLYIKGCSNKFLYSVYVLQPNEYLTFQKGISVLKNNLQVINVDKFQSRIYAIDNAISFIKQHFDVEDPVQEISNALMNLYDGGNRECSEGIQDLVIRCAICSYEDEEDYGVDKVSILLDDNYVKTLEKSKIKQEERER